MAVWKSFCAEIFVLFLAIWTTNAAESGESDQMFSNSSALQNLSRPIQAQIRAEFYAMFTNNESFAQLERNLTIILAGYPEAKNATLTALNAMKAQETAKFQRFIDQLAMESEKQKAQNFTSILANDQLSYVDKCNAFFAFARTLSEEDRETLFREVWPTTPFHGDGGGEAGQWQKLIRERVNPCTIVPALVKERAQKWNETRK